MIFSFFFISDCYDEGKNILQGVSQNPGVLGPLRGGSGPLEHPPDEIVNPIAMCDVQPNFLNLVNNVSIHHLGILSFPGTGWHSKGF